MSRLYETDSYLSKIKTVVTESGTDEKGNPFICLEDTIFFPKEGGQNADTGYLYIVPDLNEDDSGSFDKAGHKIRILDGIITGRNTCSSTSDRSKICIKYIVSESVEAGAYVSCVLDWDIRYDRMQNHSGEHIVSGILHSKYGVNNVGFHLSDTGFVTLDFDGVFTYEQVIGAEKEANRVIYENMLIRDSYPSKEELKDIDYRSKIDIDGQVRLITIGNDVKTVDVCACCAPHVARTGEIGIIKVMSVINWKGGIRVSMLCGRRALEYINKEHDILTQTARTLSTEIVNVPEIVNLRCSEITELKLLLNAALEGQALDRVGRADADETGCLFVPADFPAASMKNVYNALTARLDGYVGVFSGNDDEGYRYYAGSRDKDARELGSKLKEALGAKGGGSEEMIQGKITSPELEIIEFFKSHRMA